ncbi:DegV family EDD domain-containing protein [Lysobacter sp. BMK333-48F3]|uniref:DegV family protein n=1 Tax=Lysobacter sp. BMK333-48F3 TaxID=2867962 RepID=UPI001C8C645E|nr:DegV family protein [Lysobacter sp. BMK333-48F3]MBX9400204.1 DegV family EDD domain-containing protein [Lysobacter sp. BMK333-48F3]
MPTARPPLTAPALRRALIAGARRVIAGRDRLNRINVFPVADGDTGNNLAHTLGSLLNGALSRRSRHIGELLQRVGDDAVDGARGNSGAILAQFLYGVAEYARAQPELDAAALAGAVRHGAEQARAALAHPVEGTILSVINAFADALDEAAQASDGDPRAGFAAALERARVALARTPQQLALLQRAGVVDAGARGFVDLLEGIAEFVDGGPRALRMRGAGGAANDACAGHAAAVPAVHEAVDPQRRWCCECLLIGEAMDRAVLVAQLEALGADSVVLAGGGERLRVHAHVGAPQRLFDACAGHGGVEAMKADDMLQQQRSVERSQRVAVVTDSAADLPDELAERLALQVVPVRVSIDGRDYLDKTALSTAEFYRRMAVSADLPRTSQPPPGDFRRCFDFLLGHRAQVLYVGLSRAVSGTLQAGEQAASRADPQRVRVFDSLNAAGGQALLAWRAAELAEAGWDTAAIVSELERLRPATRTWAMARDIRHAVRGGRIPAWAGALVRWTGLTPVAAMRADGRLGVRTGLFARAGAAQALARYVVRQLPAGERWRAIVGHCDARADGERLLAELRRRLALSEAWLVETGPALGAHAGRGALLVSLQPAPAADV